MNFLVIIFFIASYVIGSLPVGFWLAQCAGIRDIRNYGSGNIGATNVSRILGWPFFVLVFVLDAGKSFAFMYLLQHMQSEYLAYVCVPGLLLGNAYSFFLQGRGGKGVATCFGIIASFTLLGSVIFALIWFTVLSLFRSAALASIVSLWGLVLIIFCYPHVIYSASLWLLITMAFFVTIQHRSNITPLLRQWNVI